jgi:hypothetical protein
MLKPSSQRFNKAMLTKILYFPEEVKDITRTLQGCACKMFFSQLFEEHQSWHG